MPLHLQSKLLRVLQEREFQKIGGEKIIRVDVRIMAATNHDLAQQVEAGRFRKDLFYRLGVVSLTIPPLRTRPEEIKELIYNLISKKFVKNSADENPVAPAALRALIAYSWPGNVRELMNVLERAFLLGNGSQITAADLPVEMLSGLDHKLSMSGEFTACREPVFALQWKEARQAMIEDFGQRYFEMLMKRSAGKMAEAAKMAGITTRALHQKLAFYGIKKESFKQKN
jgi:DNA-binding NtrC family response regulator